MKTLKAVILAITFGPKLITENMEYGDKPDWLVELYDELSQSTTEVREEFAAYMSKYLSDKRLHILNSGLAQIESYRQGQMYMRNNDSPAKMFWRSELTRYVDVGTFSHQSPIPAAMQHHYKAQNAQLLTNLFKSNWKNPEESIALCVVNDLFFTIAGKAPLGSHGDPAKHAEHLQIAKSIYASIDQFDLNMGLNLSDQPTTYNFEVFTAQLPALRESANQLGKFDGALHQDFTDKFLADVKKEINKGVEGTTSLWKNFVAKVTSHEDKGVVPYKAFRQLLMDFPKFFAPWSESFKKVECPYYAQLKAYQLLCAASIQFLQMLIDAIGEDNSIEEPVRSAAEATKKLFFAMRNQINIRLNSAGVLENKSVEEEFGQIAKGAANIMEGILDVAESLSISSTETKNPAPVSTSSNAVVANTTSDSTQNSPPKSVNAFLLALQNAVHKRADIVEKHSEVKHSQGTSSVAAAPNPNVPPPKAASKKIIDLSAGLAKLNKNRKAKTIDPVAAAKFRQQQMQASSVVPDTSPLAAARRNLRNTGSIYVAPEPKTEAQAPMQTATTTSTVDMQSTDAATPNPPSPRPGGSSPPK